MPESAAAYSPETWHNVRSEVDEAPVHIFVMGVNRWRDEQEWPLARARYTPFYLASKGHANSLTGDGTLQIFAVPYPPALQSAACTTER